MELAFDDAVGYTQWGHGLQQWQDSYLYHHGNQYSTANLIEHFPAIAKSVRLLTCIPRLIWNIYILNSAKVNHLKQKSFQTKLR